jgi:SpoVK/Ycf46/Vps4 family AAA+-type ATPase
MIPNNYFGSNYHQEINSISNVNLILSSNLTMLNNCLAITNTQIEKLKIEKLKKEKEELEKQVESGKRKYDYDDKNNYTNGNCTNNNCTNDNCKNNYDESRYKKNRYVNNYKRVNNRYYLKKYYPNQESWSEDKIKEYFKNLKCLKDIISLKDELYKIRHNEKMLKLYNIIRPIKKLDNMIGLDNVKQEIFKIVIYFIQNPHTDEYLHTVISGPPGVGKTELAKIYSEIFVRLGILKTDKFIIIKRDDLVAEYLGQTSHRTKKLLESAMGGVVFLDEGYSLGNYEKRDSFAKEAIDMINQYLSERKKDFMFVIAGYEQDLEKCFFSFNKGLKRRFSHWINIEKYTNEELVKIFELKIKELGYGLDLAIGKKDLGNFFEKNYRKFENYAGDIEKFINYIKYEQSFRCFRDFEQNKIININDLKNSIDKFGEVKTDKPPPGMYC